MISVQGIVRKQQDISEYDCDVPSGDVESESNSLVDACGHPDEAERNCTFNQVHNNSSEVDVAEHHEIESAEEPVAQDECEEMREK